MTARELKLLNWLFRSAVLIPSVGLGLVSAVAVVDAAAQAPRPPRGLDENRPIAPEAMGPHRPEEVLGGARRPRPAAPVTHDVQTDAPAKVRTHEVFGPRPEPASMAPHAHASRVATEDPRPLARLASAVLPRRQTAPAPVLVPQSPPVAVAPPVASAPEVGAADSAPLITPLCKAQAAILVDAATGTVLYQKNSRVRRPVASTTKIMAATVLLETAQLSDIVSFSDKASHTPYANLNAKPGELFPMRDLLYAILLRSSNDACVAVGEHMFGSAAAYAQRMTARARAIGARDTNFVTPNGLHDPNHYSTAYDLALITRDALRNPVFSEAVGTRSFTLSRSINKKDLLVRNHNKLLTRYEGADGVKTGYVRQSGKCLVASSTRLDQAQPWKLIAVVLGSPDTYGDSSRLMDWGRMNFQPVFVSNAEGVPTGVPVSGGRGRLVALRPQSEIAAVRSRSDRGEVQWRVRVASRLKAPVTEGQTAGAVEAWFGEQKLGAVPLLATYSVPAAPPTWALSGLAGAAPWTMVFILLITFVLRPRYGRTITKGARLVWRRCTARRRGVDPRW